MNIRNLLTGQTSLRCRWQTRATRCSRSPCCTRTSTVSVINWWLTTVTSLSHWPSN